MALRLLLPAFLIAALLAAPGCARCGPSNCAGCCDAQGTCQLPTPDHCGQGGAACQTCASLQLCASGACTIIGSGGHSGGSGAAASGTAASASAASSAGSTSSSAGSGSAASSGATSTSASSGSSSTGSTGSTTASSTSGPSTAGGSTGSAGSTGSTSTSSTAGSTGSTGSSANGSSTGSVGPSTGSTGAGTTGSSSSAGSTTGSTSSTGSNTGSGSTSGGSSTTGSTGASGSTGAVGSTGSSGSTGALPGETCAEAIPLPYDTTVSGDTTAYASDYTGTPGNDCTYGPEDGPDVVYRFTPPVTGSYSFRVDDGSGLTDFAIYVSTTCPDPVFASCPGGGGADQYGAGQTESVTLPLVGGLNYYVVVDAYAAGQRGAFGVSVTGSITPGATCDACARDVDCASGLVCEQATHLCQVQGGCSADSECGNFACDGAAHTCACPTGGPATTACTGAPALAARLPGDSDRATGDTTGQTNHGTTTCGSDLAPESFFALILDQQAYVSATVTPAAGSRLDPVVALLSACRTGQYRQFNSELACSSDGSGPGRPVSLNTADPLPPGTYYVAVDGYDSSPGAFALQVALTAGAVDGGHLGGSDACASATPLGAHLPGDRASAADDTSTAGVDGYASCGSGFLDGPDQFYALTLSQPARVTATVTPVGAQGTAPILSLLGACGVDANNRYASALACSSSGGAAAPVTVYTASPLPAGTYYLAVGGYYGSAGPYTLRVSLSP